MRKKYLRYAFLVLLAIFTLGVSYAAFSDKGKYSGATFNVASADLKLLNDTAQGLDPVNLVDEKQGPVFNNIGPEWTQQYGIKLYNNATSALTITSNAFYETANDPAELRNYIYCEIFEWNDTNSDGLINEGEVGVSLGMKTFIKWKTEGLSLGQIPMGEVKGYALRFSTTPTFPVTKQGASGVFDFEFSSVGE